MHCLVRTVVLAAIHYDLSRVVEVVIVLGRQCHRETRCVECNVSFTVAQLSNVVGTLD